MRGLVRLALRSLAARPLRTALTIVGVALGVGVLYAALATDAGIESSIDRTVRDLVGRADLRIAAFSDVSLSADTVHTAATTPGVETAAPQLERRTYLQPVPGQGSPLPGAPVTVLGIDPELDPRVHDLPLASGQALSRPNEPSALITERLARDEGLGLGSEIELNGPAANPDDLRFRVVGILPGDGPLVGAFGRTVVVPIARAEAAFALDGPSRLDLLLADGANADAVSIALERRLTAQPYVLSSPSDLAVSLRASTADFRGTVALVAAVALFVGAFLIFNTLSMTVVERLREIGLLRAAGTTRRQVVAFVLAGAVAIGVLGSIVGIGVGVALAAAMAAFVGQVGSVTLGGIEAPLDGIVLAVAVGILVTIAAALEPAVRASRVAPVEALKARLAPGGGTAAQLRWLLGVFVIVGVAGLALWPTGAGAAGVARSLVVYALLLLVALASPFLVAPLGRVAGIPFALMFRIEERLARGSLVRDRSRTALTVGALTMGLAMIVALGGLATATRAAATAWLASVVPGDEVVTSIRPVALDEQVLDDLSGAPGVERVTPVATFDVAYQGIRLDAAAVNGQSLLADGRLVFEAGDRTAALTGLDRPGTAIVPRAMADRLGLRVGDTMTFAVGGGSRAELRVTGVVERSLPGRAGEALLVGWADATTVFDVPGADFFAVRFAPGAPASARAGLERLARNAALEPTTIDAVEGAISDALGRVFGLFDALAFVAIAVAALGIVNTLSMNVLERVPEIGILRAAGMTRRQVSRMVVVEAGVLGIVGSVLGILTGLVAAALMVGLTSAGGAETGLRVPWPSVALAAVLGVGVAMLAAYYPARLAGRLSIVRAVRAE